MVIADTALKTDLTAGEPPTYLLKFDDSESGIYISVGLKSIATRPIGIKSSGFDISNVTYFCINYTPFISSFVLRAENENMAFNIVISAINLGCLQIIIAFNAFVFIAIANGIFNTVECCGCNINFFDARF